MTFERVCGGLACAVQNRQLPWQGSVHGGLGPSLLRHRLSLGSTKIFADKSNYSNHNEINNARKPHRGTTDKEGDQTLSSAKVVADTSDEESNLPDADKCDDSKSSTFASLDSDDIRLADELAESFRFEGAGIAARNIKAAHDLEEGEKATSSLEPKQPAQQPVRDDCELYNAGRVQYACFSTQHAGRPLRAGSLHRSHSDQSAHSPETGFEAFEDRLAEQPRYQGWVQAIGQIQVEEHPSNKNVYSLREDAEIGGLDFAFKGNDEQQNSEDNNKHGNRNERDTESSSEDNLMEFGSQGDIRDRDRDRDRDSSTASNVLGGLAAKAAKAATELSPLTNLSSMRGIYRENRELSRKSQEKVHISSLRPSLKTAVARIIEVAAGRAALIGLVATPLSEIMYRQSILSQLLGRWEGVRHVEYAIPTARMLAEGVLLASLAFTAVEALVPPSGLPPRWPFTRLSPFLQLWIGRIAAMTFAALLLFEVQQSNRPAFFWFLHL